MPLEYIYTLGSNQGGRPYMEDVMCVKEHLTRPVPEASTAVDVSSNENSEQETSYFGVFDGHGGSSAAAFAKDRLLDEIMKHEGFWSDNDDRVMHAIKSGFESTHRLMWTVVDTWPRTTSGRKSTAGTTASVLFLRGNKLYIAHVGDSSVVLAQQNCVSGAGGSAGVCGGGSDGSAGSAGSVGSAGDVSAGAAGGVGAAVAAGGNGTAVAGDGGAADGGGGTANAGGAGDGGAAAADGVGAGSGGRENGEKKACNRNICSAVHLTKDHKPDDAEERKRIERSGGRVELKNGVARVVWARPALPRLQVTRRCSLNIHVDYVPFLAIARSLGDLWSYNLEKDSYAVSPVPDVRVVRLVAGLHRHIVLASDGLWNVVPAQQCVRVLDHLSSVSMQGSANTKPSTPAALLVSLALDRWLARKIRADNVSVIVISFPSSPSNARTEAPRSPLDILSANKIPEHSHILRDISQSNNIEFKSGNSDETHMDTSDSNDTTAASKTADKNTKCHRLVPKPLRDSSLCKDCFRSMNLKSIRRLPRSVARAADSVMTTERSSTTKASCVADETRGTSNSEGSLFDIEIYDVTVSEIYPSSVLDMSHIIDSPCTSPGLSISAEQCDEWTTETSPTLKVKTCSDVSVTSTVGRLKPRQVCDVDSVTSRSNVPDVVGMDCGDIRQESMAVDDTSLAHTGTAHTDTAHTGTAHTGTAHTGTAHTDTAHTGTAHTSLAHTGTAHTGTAHTCTAHVGTAYTSLAHKGTAHTGTAHTGTAHTGTAHTGTARTRTAHTGTARTSTARTSTARTSTARTSLADGATRMILDTPTMPPRHDHPVSGKHHATCVPTHARVKDLSHTARRSVVGVSPTPSYASVAALHHATSPDADDDLLVEIRRALESTVSPRRRSIGVPVDINSTSSRRSSLLSRRVSNGSKHHGKPSGSGERDRFRIPVTAEQRREYYSRRSSFGCLRLVHRLE